MSCWRSKNDLISNAFIWRCTKKGFDFWNKVDNIFRYVNNI